MFLGLFPSLTIVPAQAAAPVITCAQGGACLVGETGPGGGKVFYIAPTDTTFTQVSATGSMCSTDCKYLEAATSASSPTWGDARYVWSGNINNSIKTTSSAIGAGYSNTLKMVAQSGAGTSGAGSATRNYLGGGKNDWYLPSKDELNQLYLQRANVGDFIGTDPLIGYWSSSEYTLDQSVIWAQVFIADNTPVIDVKEGMNYVRSIRAFAPASPPAAPTGLTATAGNGQISIAFTAGADNGSTISNYKYSLDGTTYTAFSPSDTTTPVVVTGLTNGTSYTIRLKAVNLIGDGAASASVTATPITVPILNATTMYIGQSLTVSGTGFNSTATLVIQGSKSLVFSQQLTISTFTINSDTSLTFTVPTASSFLTGATSANWTIQARNTSIEWGNNGTSTLQVYLPGPTFSLSASSLNGTVGTSITSYAITSTGGAIASYAIAPALSNGTLTFDTTTGLLSGTPNTAASAATYTITATNTTNTATQTFSLTVNALTPVVVYVPPTPVPYLRTIAPPKINFKDGKFICTPGTYNAGYTLDGVVQGSTTTFFTPSTFTYNLLINGVVQTSLSVTSSTASATWSIPSLTSGSFISCSVSVSANSISNTDKSTDNTSAVSSALSTQATSVATANTDYSASQSANSKAYQKALVENRALWRKQIEATRTNYYETIARITANDGTKKMIADKSTALKVYIAAQKKSAADYKVSQPAALSAREAANKAAIDAKSTAIAKANALYGTFIESIGYGVLIP